MSTIESNKKDFSAKGTISNPYTEEEYQQLQAEGKDVACFVEGRGFCAPAAMAPPTNPGSPSDPSDPSDPEPEPSSEPSEPSVFFSSVHLKAGTETIPRRSLPIIADIVVSWSEGDFVATTAPEASASFVIHGDNSEYLYDDEQSYLNRPTWDSSFRLKITGRFVYFVTTPIPGSVDVMIVNPTVVEIGEYYQVPHYYFEPTAQPESYEN